MEKKLLKGAIDVDDKRFHGCLIDVDTKAEFCFSIKANVGSLVRKLRQFELKGYRIELCYEATYLGYSLYRSLKGAGFFCEVIAPSLIPLIKGKRVKTDRLDSKQLAHYYVAGLLTSIHVPSQEEEEVRSLLRSRKAIVQKCSDFKRHIISACRRMGLHYRDALQQPDANYWTKKHYAWLRQELKKHSSSVFHFNVERLLESCCLLENEIRLYEARIEFISKDSRYFPKVKSLTCYRGIQTLSAMTLISELSDVRRFCHPKKLVSYCGFDITEYSSGGKEKRFSTTKLGNKHLRTALVEICQFALHPPKVSQALEKRRLKVDPSLIEIADRCMQRLNKKGTRLLYKGKPRNKVIVACAREMLGFVWESLKKAA